MPPAIVTRMEIDELRDDLMQYQEGGGKVTLTLAREILATIELLLHENTVGRRPWTENWETYFGKCMDDAHGLI